MATYEELSVKVDQSYTSCYCEENIWKLCEKIKKSDKLEHLFREENAYIVFISNDGKSVPLWNQSASDDAGGLVIWDYHVILIIKNEGSVVFDLDTRLPYPCAFNHYTLNTFGSNENNFDERFHRKFRVTGIQDYMNHFASDRSHMKDTNGDWIKPPPSYPCIKTKDSNHNIDTFISMDQSKGWGVVLSLEKFNKMFL